MPTLDQLLSRALLRADPEVPADTVPYEDCAYPAFAPDGAALVDDEPTDDAAALDLQTLCEVVVTHSTADTLEFLTDQLPQPRGAWILGCALQLADAEEGARFWWQYAAGAAEEAAAPASYCLYLHHRSRGESHAASFWLDQVSLDARHTVGPLTLTGVAPENFQRRFDTSLATVLRILSLLSSVGRPRSHRADAITNYMAHAVADGYATNPGVEIPLPGPCFADRIAFILDATPPWNRHTSPRSGLPSRLRHMRARAIAPHRAREPVRGGHP
jgi:hypothetical protein